MPTPDGLTEQTAEVQDALRHVLQESGAAGTGPLTLPPPADITSTQQRSEVRADDPDSYSNTLHIDLYRDGDGKVWTQPGPGHVTADITMRIRRQNGEWQVVTEHRRVTRRRRFGRRIVTDYERDAGATSGAPVTELRDADRVEQFAPQSAKEAIRQTIAKLQAEHAVYAYDPNAPAPSNATGIVPNGLLGLAAVAAAAAIAAFAGVGPFASAPAAATQVGTIRSGTSAAISAAPAAATAAAASGCGPNGSPNGAEDVTATGAVAAHITQDCGQGPVGGPPRCNPVQTAPYGTNGQQSYTYDWYGGFYAGGIEYELHFPGSGIGPSFSVQFPRDPTAPNRGHVTMTSYENFAPASVWQSPDSAPTGAMTWTATTVTMSNVTLTSVGSAPKPAAPVTLNGTWAVHCTAGAAAGAAATALASNAAFTPVATAVAAVVAPAPSTGPSPWGPGLAVLAIASAASGVLLRTRKSAVTPPSTSAAPRDCSALEAELQRLQARLAEDQGWLEHDASSGGLGANATNDARWNEVVSERRRMVAADRINIARVEEALTRCRAGAGADLVPALRGVDGADESALSNAAAALAPTLDDPQGTEPGGFAPEAPSQGPSDDDEPKGRQEIG